MERKMAADQAKLYTMLEGMADGDKQAFNQFYDATINSVFGVIIKVTANRQLAEKVASDVYGQAWRTAANYDANLSTPRAWLVMMARSLAIDALKQEHSMTTKQLPTFDITDEANPAPLTETLPDEKTTTLDELLGLLSTTEQQMVALAFYHGMSHTEIATHMDKPLGTVKTIMRQAQTTLRSAARTTIKTECKSASAHSPDTLIAEGYSG